MSAPRKRPRTGGPRQRGAPLTQQDLAKSLGLRQFREKAEMTQMELAPLLGVSQSTLAEYEGAKRAIPDDVFEALLEIAKAHAESDGGNLTAAGLGDAPPPGPGQSVPPAGDTAPNVPGGDQIASAMSAAMLKELSANQKKMAKDLEAVYQLLGHVVGRFSDQAGAVIYGDSELLAQSAVAAAEESELIRRFVELMSQGPVFTFALLHALTAMKIEAAIREQRRRDRELRQLQTQAAPLQAVPTPAPMPAPMSEQIDPLEHYRTASA